MTPKEYIETFTELILDLQRNDIIKNPNEYVGLEDLRFAVKTLEQCFIYNGRIKTV